jgi:hypothetical protein
LIAPSAKKPSMNYTYFKQALCEDDMSHSRKDRKKKKGKEASRSLHSSPIARARAKAVSESRSFDEIIEELQGQVKKMAPDLAMEDDELKKFKKSESGKLSLSKERFDNKAKPRINKEAEETKKAKEKLEQELISIRLFDRSQPVRSERAFTKQKGDFLEKLGNLKKEDLSTDRLKEVSEKVIHCRTEKEFLKLLKTEKRSVISETDYAKLLDSYLEKTQEAIHARKP